MNNRSIFFSSFVLKILAEYRNEVTYPDDELFLYDKVCFGIVELLKQPLPPKPVLVKKQEEILESYGLL